MKPPTLPTAFDRWPWLERLAFPGLTVKEISACLVWGIGDDWKDLTIDRVPDRIRARLGMVVDEYEDPVTTLARVRELWDRALLTVLQ